MALSARHLSFSFQLAQGSFDGKGADTAEYPGLRASVNISRAGGNSLGFADIRIWGLPLETMNKLTVINVLAYPEMANKLVTVSAGDDINGSGVCFQGTIKEAWADGSSPPDMVFHISAFTNAYQMNKPVAPMSYRGSVDAAIMLANLASQMNLGFENGGVTGVLVDPYKPGDLGTQLNAVCRDLDCEKVIDNGVLAVWPRGQSRGGAAVQINPDTGMVGYPAFTESGCRFRTIYNPNLAFGRPVEVKSQLDAANGTWTVANVAHSLDAEIPGGQWFTDVECTLLGHTLPIIGK